MKRLIMKCTMNNKKLNHLDESCLLIVCYVSDVFFQVLLSVPCFTAIYRCALSFEVQPYLSLSPTYFHLLSPIDAMSAYSFCSSVLVHRNVVQIKYTAIKINRIKLKKKELKL
jgi:hypothetical protein